MSASTTEAQAGLVERRQGGVAVLTIDRPAQRNALSRALLAALGSASRRLADDPTARAVVIHGAGGKAFCAGADLAERRGMSDDQVRDMLGAYRTELAPLDRMPKPVIAAIDGVALGGGFELALACDLRVASRGAVVGLPEVSLGVIPGAGGTQRLTRIVGEARAKELILFAKRLSADEAHALGLVSEVTAEGGALARALEWATALSEGAPIALASALDAIDHALDGSLDRGLEGELAAYERCLVSADRLEALAAFAEKRTPRFTGR